MSTRTPEPCLTGISCKNSHETMTVRMIMNSRGDGLWPAHQDQVELGVALMHKVPGVLVLVPLCELLEVIWIKLVSIDKVLNFLDNNTFFVSTKQFQ